MITYLKSPKQISIITFHILFWIIHFGYRLYLLGYFYTFDNTEFFAQLILLPIRIFITYFTIYFVLRRYLIHKKFIGAIVWFLVSLVGILLVRRLIIFEVISSFAPHLNHNLLEFWDLKHIIHYIVYIYPVVAVAVIIFIVQEWFKKEKLQLEIQKERLEAELKYLKHQINPHFLFNTINNIYSLVLEKSKKAPDAILKLSDMLNYLLYESNFDKIPLNKEIQNLNDYIELEQFRYADKLEVVFNYKIKTNENTIPPLILLPFVENAFKHGAGESLKNSWIHINLKEENHHLTFKVENSIDENVSPQNNEQDGIGLNNVKKRLELLFPDKHELKILKSSESFIITLQLDISDD
ncbi:MAG: hypothetical protein D8M58_07535 [Calditrichaeota bacterium]|nr:MAG: hypothetical protein DWQ03_18955 [Calditrichota bacterium]MBL1205233.1 hypothetical protein [Calditrichota bacterium]NOG45062.1 histidine kinase [Calditrichota bacterium]